jgi:uncharacterized protein (DUF58 family)
MTAVVHALGHRVGQAVRQWARRRQGTDPTSVQLDSRRIYILPTRAGLILGVIVFAMLLGAMNYNNNMGIALTFLVAAIAVVSIHHCHRNLLGLQLRFRGVRPAFVGEPLGFCFALANPAATGRWQIMLGWDGHRPSCHDLEALALMTLNLPLPAEQRGLRRAPRLQISTCYPLGLFRSWSWVDMDIEGLVYPRPAPPTRLRLDAHPGRMTTSGQGGGEDDFSGLREYRAGDSPRRIAWKALARTGDTLVTEYRDGSADRIWIDWNALRPDVGFESKISALTRQVLDAHRAGFGYGLRVPGGRIPPGAGESQRHECLKCLALLQSGAGHRPAGDQNG